MNKNNDFFEVGVIPSENIGSKIYMIRKEKVMLDFDLALLYQVETKVLNQAVKRNSERFPPDFVFMLNKNEEANLKSQIVTSNYGRRKPVFAFTEQGIAMLSGVLRSPRAIQVNIQIMRTFTRLRQMLSSHKELKEKIEQLEKKYDGQFRLIFKTIQQIITEEEKPKGKIGFKAVTESLKCRVAASCIFFTSL